MKQPLSMKFTLTYLILSLFSLVLVTLAGSYFAEKYFERDLSSTMYQEACAIASYDSVENNLSGETLEPLRDSLNALAVFQNTVIWILNNKGEIIFSSRQDINPKTPVPVKNFDAVDWGNQYYQKGNFYGYFQENRLSVIAPITPELAIKGYVAIHYRMDSLYQTRDDLVKIIQIIFLVICAMFYLLVFIYIWYVQRPLQEIIKGASAYASGNLTYEIPVKHDDELGYLANILNSMSSELNRSGEYKLNFIANISHDFRSPLTSIKGYIEAILDGTIPVEMQDKYLRIVSAESERLENLTQGLLTLNELDIKKRMMNITSFDINETIKNTALFFEGVCTDRRIRLELILTVKVLYVNADQEQIRQVLYNLLDNAIKFSDDSSVITMETTEKNEKVFVSVKDQGSGISKDNIPKIWHRFYKQDSSRGKDRKGTGLGLPIVQEIINAHQQNIDVVSTEGVGTKFIFSLEKSK